MAEGVVVVGGGIAGVSTIAALRDGGFDGDVTLVDAGEFPYDRPPLSKDYLAGTISAADIALKPAKWFDDNAVRLIPNTTVTAVRPDTTTVELGTSAPLSADWVVLATGGVPARPSIPGADAERIHVLRTIADADGLRQVMVPDARILIVGAGLIGAEVASTATGLGCRVLLVDPVDAPLKHAFGMRTAQWLHAMHAYRGVGVRQAEVAEFVTTATELKVFLQTGTLCESVDAVVLAVGMVADTRLAKTAGLEVDRGIIVGPGQQTSIPTVLAVGDAACTRSRHGAVARSEHWEAARHDGARAAATILDTEPPAPTAPWFWTDRHGVHVEVVGSPGDSDDIIIRGQFGEPPFSVFALETGYVVGAVSVADPTASRAARRMIDQRIAVDRSLLGDSSTDLRRLLRRGQPSHAMSLQTATREEM